MYVYMYIGQMPYRIPTPSRFYGSLHLSRAFRLWQGVLVTAYSAYTVASRPATSAFKNPASTQYSSLMDADFKHHTLNRVWHHKLQILGTWALWRPDATLQKSGLCSSTIAPRSFGFRSKPPMPRRPSPKGPKYQDMEYQGGPSLKQKPL